MSGGSGVRTRRRRKGNEKKNKQLGGGWTSDGGASVAGVAPSSQPPSDADQLAAFGTRT